MPQIREYNSQTSTPTNINTATVNPNAAAAVSESMGGVGQAVQGIGEAIDRKTRMNELSDANVAMSELQAKHTIILNEKSASGDFDTNKFLNDYQADVDKMSERFGSSDALNFIKTTAGNSKEHFSINAAAVATELAAVKFRQNVDKAKNMFGNAVYNDPTALDLAISNYSLYIDSVSKGDKRTMKAAEEAKRGARSDLAIESVKGYARLNPDAAEAALRTGHYDSYFDANKKEQMLSFVDQVRNGLEVKARLEERKIEKANKLAGDRIVNKAIIGIHEGDFDIEGLLNAPVEQVDGFTKQRILDIAKQHDKKEDKEKEASNEIFYRMKIDSGEITDTGPLQEAAYNGMINPRTYDKLFKYLSNPSTTEGAALKVARSNFNKQAYSLLVQSANGIPQADGPKRMQAMNEEIDMVIKEKRAKGVSLYDMYSPTSKDSLYPIIKKYQPSLQDNIKGMTDRLNAGKEKPKMSPADYLKENK